MSTPAEHYELAEKLLEQAARRQEGARLLVAAAPAPDLLDVAQERERVDLLTEAELDLKAAHVHAVLATVGMPAPKLLTDVLSVFDPNREANQIMALPEQTDPWVGRRVVRLDRSGSRLDYPVVDDTIGTVVHYVGASTFDPSQQVVAVKFDDFQEPMEVRTLDLLRLDPEDGQRG